MPDTPSLNLSPEDLPRQLFDNPKLHAYAVLDGASNPALLDHLYDGERPEFACLYRGELEPDIAECAPYLVRLKQGSAFAEWLLHNGLGQHWGIFALSRVELHPLLQHFRKHNMVYDEDGKHPLLFRYYDPRVLRGFLSAGEHGEKSSLFGPVEAFIAEAEEGGYLRFDRPA